MNMRTCLSARPPPSAPPLRPFAPSPRCNGSLRVFPVLRGRRDCAALVGGMGGDRAGLHGGGVRGVDRTVPRERGTGVAKGNISFFFNGQQKGHASNDQFFTCTKAAGKVKMLVSIPTLPKNARHE